MPEICKYIEDCIYTRGSLLCKDTYLAKSICSHYIYKNAGYEDKQVKLLEYDKDNNVVDVFVRKDPTCPFPFHDQDWFHQGFYFEEFVRILNEFFEKYDLGYEIKNKE